MASKSKRRKTKFKWTKELGFLILFIVVILIAAIFLNLPTNAEVKLSKYNDAIETYNSDNSTSYVTLASDHHFKEVSNDSLAKKKASSDYTIVWYGVLTNATFLEQLYNINEYAESYDIKYVYLYFADYVNNADTEKQATEAYRNKLNGWEAKLNNSVDKDQKEIDLETFPAIFVFKDDKLIFNSQTYSTSDDSEEYSYAEYILKAFSLTKEA